MKHLLALLLITSFITESCNNDKTSGSTANTASSEAEKPKDGFYFTYTIDGKEITLNVDEDVITSFNTFKDKSVFKIFAGKENGANLVLTIPSDLKNTISVPSGSAEAGDEIAQGSVSLQGYPENGYTFNSYDFLDAQKQKPVADAIVITEATAINTKEKIIAGTINVTTVTGANFKNDPAVKSYEIKGKFRIKSDKF